MNIYPKEGLLKCKHPQGSFGCVGGKNKKIKNVEGMENQENRRNFSFLSWCLVGGGKMEG